MSILFGRDRSVISKHITNIFLEKEAEEKSNVHFLHIPNSVLKEYLLKDNTINEERTMITKDNHLIISNPFLLM